MIVRLCHFDVAPKRLLLDGLTNEEQYRKQAFAEAQIH
jgi:hypothetical protein